MSEIPGARVVRGGKGEGGQGASAEVAPAGPVLPLAPRALPRGLARRLIFGGPLALFGWLFAATGMAFVLVFLPMLDLSLGDYDGLATATITSIEETSASENDRTIHRVRYTFVDHAGVARHGESYTVDPPAELGAWEVEYRGGDPSESRLEGMRRRAFSPVFAFVLLFPIAGLGLALGPLPGALRKLRLLRYGVEARGKLLGKRETLVHVNDRPVMALTFEYEVDGRRYTTTVKTLAPTALEDDDREAMLCDPRAPWRATTLDHLPGSVKVTASGALEARAGYAFHLLLLPAGFAILVAATVVRML
ncbi:MAG TPA: DUF3592 domain-containing protein [Kofleriaceae bacterium]|nr:DUF3592 domain-containing protein [Kofleriaceae bacterium]